jgi:hypothetical protein
MRLVPIFIVAVSLSSPHVSVGASQDHHGSAESVMGFDQERTSHHFFLFTDGGAIDVSVKDGSDTKNREAIRSHLPHIAVMFGSGNFNAPMLVHDSANVPGTKVLTSRKEAVRYQYVETPNGGRVNVITRDREALEALHSFLKFQIAEHNTGDTTAVQTR